MLTKQEYEEAYRKFPPGKYESFFLRYISLHSVQNNTWAATMLSSVLICVFLIELLFHYFNFDSFRFIPSCLYGVVLCMAIGFWLIGWHKKRKRCEKIRKHLGITKKQYQDLTTAYYYHRYPSMKDYIKHNSKITV